MSESVPKPYGLRQKTGPQRTFFAGIVYLYVLKKLKKNETDEKISENSMGGTALLVAAPAEPARPCVLGILFRPREDQNI